MNIEMKKDEFNGGGNFPLEYFTDFLKFLSRHSNLVEMITYNDLAWGSDKNYLGGYKEERRRWESSLKSGKRDSKKIYVLLQHDVDSRAERAMKVIAEEIKLGIKSNIMIFNKRHDRKILKHKNSIAITEYPLDISLLQYAEKDHGFVIAYHSNAFENSLFETELAKNIMRDDIRALSKHFNIQYFSAHGGIPGPDGKNNNSLIPPEDVSEKVRWVHNGASPFFDGNFSDGGPNSLKRDPNTRDLRDFVRMWKMGGRYRILTHPQYYHSPCNSNKRLGIARWYRETLSYYQDGIGVPPWNEVTIVDRG